MRFLDEESNRILNRVSVFLTESEANELRDTLDLLLKDSNVHHEHVSSDDFQKELTISIYDKRKIDSYDDRAQSLILSDI